MFQSHNSFKTTLQNISDILTAKNIVWCVGASGSLYVQGIAIEPNDLDIIVDINQFDIVCELLKSFSPRERQTGTFGGEKYYKVELQATEFPAEVVGLGLDPSTLVTKKWEDIAVVVHPLTVELEMYKKRPGKERTVTLIQEALGETER